MTKLNRLMLIGGIPCSGFSLVKDLLNNDPDFFISPNLGLFAHPLAWRNYVLYKKFATQTNLFEDFSSMPKDFWARNGICAHTEEFTNDLNYYNISKKEILSILSNSECMESFVSGMRTLFGLTNEVLVNVHPCNIFSIGDMLRAYPETNAIILKRNFIEIAILLNQLACKKYFLTRETIEEYFYLSTTINSENFTILDYKDILKKRPKDLHFNGKNSNKLTLMNLPQSKIKSNKSRKKFSQNRPSLLRFIISNITKLRNNPNIFEITASQLMTIYTYNTKIQQSTNKCLLYPSGSTTSNILIFGMAFTGAVLKKAFSSQTTKSLEKDISATFLISTDYFAAFRYLIKSWTISVNRKVLANIKKHRILSTIRKSRYTTFLKPFYVHIVSKTRVLKLRLSQAYTKSYFEVNHKEEINHKELENLKHYSQINPSYCYEYDLVICIATNYRTNLIEFQLEEIEAFNKCSGKKVGVSITCTYLSDYHQLSALAERYKFAKINRTFNRPLGQKWQSCVDHAKNNFSIKYLMILGSDDFVDSNYLLNSILQLDNQISKLSVLLPKFWKVYDVKTNSMYNLNYINELIPLGAGRVFSRPLLELINWNIFDTKLESQLDNRAYESIQIINNLARTANLKELVITRLWLTSFQGSLISIKSSTSNELNPISLILSDKNIHSAKYSSTDIVCVTNKINSPGLKQLFDQKIS